MSFSLSIDARLIILAQFDTDNKLTVDFSSHPIDDDGATVFWVFSKLPPEEVSALVGAWAIPTSVWDARKDGDQWRIGLRMVPSGPKE